MNKTKANYGNFTPVVGDILFVYGRQKQTFKVTAVDSHTVDLDSIYDWSMTVYISDTRKADPIEASYHDQNKKEHNKRKRDEKKALKLQDAAIETELNAFRDFCNADHATAFDGPMFDRLRNLSEGAKALLYNTGFK